MSRTILAAAALILGLYDTAHAENFCQSHKPPATGSREVRMRAKAVYDALCEAHDDSWWLDVEDASETEKLAHMTACLAKRPNVEADVASFVAWCADDVATYDFKKGSDMIKQLGLGSRVASDWKAAASWQEKAKQLASDPQWKPIVDAAAQGKAAWHASVDADHELFASARELVSNAETGCTTKASELLTKYLAKQKPKTVDAVKAALETPVGFQLYWTMYECAGLDSNGPEAFVLYYTPPKWEGGLASADELKIDPARGPRAAAALAVTTALKKSGDRKLSSLRVENVGGLDRDARREPEWLANKDIHYSPARGTIAAIKPDKDGKLLVTFKTETIVRDIASCKATSQISRINSDGTVDYIQDCHVSGQEKEKVTPHPIFVAKAWAAGLKPGKMISYFFSGNSMGTKVTDGTVAMIWTDAKRTAITGWAGLSW